MKSVSLFRGSLFYPQGGKSEPEARSAALSLSNVTPYL